MTNVDGTITLDSDSNTININIDYMSKENLVNLPISETAFEHILSFGLTTANELLCSIESENETIKIKIKD